MNNRGPWDYERDTSKVSCDVSTLLNIDMYLQSRAKMKLKTNMNDF